MVAGMKLLQRLQPEVLEYELLPRNARIRRGIDRAQDEGVLAHVCHGEASCGRGRAVSRWWSDKLWIIFDQLQVFAIIWIASCPAARQRFPTQWCNSISWSPYLNLDILGKNSWDAKALQSGNTTEAQLQAQLDSQGAAAAAAIDDVQDVDSSSSLWIICAPGIVTMAMWIYFVVGSANVKHALGVQSRFVPTVERLIIRLGCAGILPWAVYTARHVTCQELDVLADWQRKFTCETYDSSQITCRARSGCSNEDTTYLPATVGIFVCVAAATLGFPLLVGLIVRRGVLFQSKSRHEGWLQGIETEYLLRFSSLWSHNHYALHSSHKRPWSYYLVFTLILKMCLAWVVAVTDGRDRGDLARDAVILSLLVLWLAAVWNIECYRLWSSQCICLVAIGCNTATMIPRFFISLGFQTQIWLRLALILPLQHGVAVLCILVLAVAFRKERWPVSEVTIWAHDIRSAEELARSGVLRSREEGGEGGANEGGRGRDGGQSVDQGPTVAEGSGGGGMAMQDGVEFGNGGGEARDGFDSRDVDMDGDIEPGLGFPWVERGSGELVVARRIERSRRVLLEETHRTREFIRTSRLRDQIQKLSHVLRVLERVKDPLRFSVEDVLDESTAFHNAHVHTTMYYYAPLMPLLRPLRARLDRRDDFMRLVPKLLRRALLKLYALRQFQVMRLECAARGYKEATLRKQEASLQGAGAAAPMTLVNAWGGVVSRVPSGVEQRAAMMVAEEEEA